MRKTRAHQAVLTLVTGAALIAPLTPLAAQSVAATTATATTTATAQARQAANQTPLRAQAADAAQAPQVARVRSAVAPPGPVVAPSYRQLALRTGGRTASVTAVRTTPFAMIGITWPYRPSSADVVARVRVLRGSKWTAWEQLHVDDGNELDPAQHNHGRSGTEPLWVGSASGVQASVTTPGGGTLRDAQVSLVQPGTRAEDATVQPEPAASTTRQSTASPAPFAMAPIVSRKGWGADESLRSYNGAECVRPVYSRTVQAAIVHHTADSNNYAPAQAPAIVRSTYAYHVKGRGWCDIGYNFLVDKSGRAFEGRYGGMLLPVRGAHALNFNTNTFGISLIGNFDTATPSAVMMERTARIIAWKFDAGYRSPLTTVVLNGKRLNTISGHRDTKQTACPGRYVYSRLPALRQRVWSLMGGSVSTEIYRYAQYLGGFTVVGQPFWGEHASGTGRGTWFEWNDLYWSSTTAARSVSGLFRTRYRQLGSAGGVLGLPTGWEHYGAVRNTHVQAFRNGTLYRSNFTSAQPVSGAILTRYGALGAERSRLGLPWSAAYPVPTGLKQIFQFGSMVWNARTGAVTVAYSTS